MISIALLRPDVSPQAVEPFRISHPDLTILTEIQDPEDVKAAIIFGGDGTVHRHLPELSKYKIPTLVVPSGSGNDFAKAIGIGNARVALEAWKGFCTTAGHTREIDLGLIRSAAGSETLFCGVAAIGMDAEANRLANQMPRWIRRRGGYILAALCALSSFKPCRFNMMAVVPERTKGISPEGMERYLIRRSGLFAAIGQTHRYGGGLKITPLAQLSDGLLDLCFVSKMNKMKMLTVLPSLYFGAHLGLKEVEYLPSKHLSVATDPLLAVYADGEYVCQTPVELEVVPGALRIIVPS